MTIAERIERLAHLLCVEYVPKKTRLTQYRGKWWLVGSPGGDHPLPNTADLRTLEQALDAIEAWFAPEVDREYHSAE